jgi:hypothetical protein
MKGKQSHALAFRTHNLSYDKKLTIARLVKTDDEPNQVISTYFVTKFFKFERIAKLIMNKSAE